MDGAGGMTKAKGSDSQIKAISESTAGAMVGMSATWSWTFLLTVALLGLGLHWVSLSPPWTANLLKKALLSVDGCQVIVVDVGTRLGTFYSSSLL